MKMSFSVFFIVCFFLNFFYLFNFFFFDARFCSSLVFRRKRSGADAFHRAPPGALCVGDFYKKIFVFLIFCLPSRDYQTFNSAKVRFFYRLVRLDSCAPATGGSEKILRTTKKVRTEVPSEAHFFVFLFSLPFSQARRIFKRFKRRPKGAGYTAARVATTGGSG